MSSRLFVLPLSGQISALSGEIEMTTLAEQKSLKGNCVLPDNVSSSNSSPYCLVFHFEDRSINQFSINILPT